METSIHARKKAHIEIAASGEAAFKKTTTLFEDVQLIHQALPELSLNDIDLSLELFGRKLAAPILIGAMTGGTQRAERLNEDLASLASELKIGFCLGSQRVMEEHPESTEGFQVRGRCPNLLLIGNIGLVQAGKLEVSSLRRLADAVAADAMALHLNPAQELIQSDGDRDFRGCRETLAKLTQELPVPLLVKETGCGISRESANILVESGVTHVEIAGAGGTSWARVESMREPSRRWLGELLGEWGIPTAASLIMIEDLPLRAIAGGGIKNAMDIAKSIALGAQACTLAQPLLSTYLEGGVDETRRFILELIEGLRSICLLTGCEKVHDLQKVPRIISPTLKEWQLQTRDLR